MPQERENISLFFLNYFFSNRFENSEIMYILYIHHISFIIVNTALIVTQTIFRALTQHLMKYAIW